MIKLKNYFILVLIWVLLFSLMPINVFAEAEITKERLEEVFNDMQIQIGDDEFIFTVSDSTIVGKSENKEYIINYSLSGENPIFSSEIIIDNNISIENDLQEKVFNLNVPAFGYMAVANLNGAKVEDAFTYSLISIMKTGLENLSEGSNSITLEKGTPVEYVSKVFENSMKIRDTEKFNSYQFTIEKQDETEDSIKLVSKLIVNKTADFSKLQEFAKEYVDDSTGTITIETAGEICITYIDQIVNLIKVQADKASSNNPNPENTTSNETSKNVDENEKNTEVPKNALPKTGWQIKYYSIAIFSIIMLIAGIVIVFKKNNKNLR